MNYIIFSILIGASAVFTFIFGCKFSSKKGSADATTGQLPVDTIKGKLTKEQIIEKLKNLANTEAPSELSAGAMCYKTAAPPNRAEYVCPVCGTKTLYTDAMARIIDREIPECRSLADSSMLSLTLDEKQFCKKCSPGITDPKLCIDFKFAGDTIKHEVCEINAEDMKLLNEFLKGKLTHKDSYDYETPLKNYISRLENILDLSPTK